MNAIAWSDFVLRVADEARAGDTRNLWRLAQQLEMADKAKQVLRDKGYGWLGVDIVSTAEMVENVSG